jgi:hypothetical protein
MKCRRIGYSLVAILIVSTTIVKSPTVADYAKEGNKPNQTDVRALANACLSHRESFPSVTCKFNYIQGTANSIDQAIRGQPGDIQTSNSSAMRWIADKQSVLLEHSADPAIWEKAKAEADKVAASSITVPVASQTILTNGSFKLNYLQPLKSASIIGPDHPPEGKIRITPFTMGLMGKDEQLSPGSMLSDCVRGKMTCEAMSSEELDGHKTVMVLITFGAPDRRQQLKYWLEPELGFLPIRSILYGNGGIELARAYWTDIRKCSGNRWFPWRAIKVTTYNSTDSTKSPGPLRAEEIRVNGLDVDNAPTRESFRIVLPKGVRLHDPNIRFAVSKLLTQDEEVGLDDLPKLHQRCLDMVPRGSELYAMWEKEQLAAANQWHFGIITATVAIALGVLALIRWRYLSRRSATTPSTNLPTQCSGSSANA